MASDKEAYDELVGRWGRLTYAQTMCPGIKVSTIKQIKIRYEPFGKSDPDNIDPTMISALRTDLLGAEQVFKEEAPQECQYDPTTGIAYGKGATNTLEPYELEKATAALKASSAIDEIANDIGIAPPQSKDGKPVWPSIPVGVKIASGVIIATIALKAIARIAGR